MAWIEQRKREDGGTSAHAVWRLGGGRGAPRQTETFAVGSDEQNLARAEGFKKMVEAAGGFWPDGWVKGEGFVRPRSGDVYTPPPPFPEIGVEYVRQIVDLSPGQRRRYLDQLGVLGRTEIRGALTFTRSVAEIREHDIKAWLIDWDRALKTKANHHGPGVRGLRPGPRAGPHRHQPPAPGRHRNARAYARVLRPTRTTSPITMIAGGRTASDSSTEASVRDGTRWWSEARRPPTLKRTVASGKTRS